ncbi:protease modulator HflC [Paraburkholderia hayleyella]|uniref:protease modulator HflC n=1 Tax=Paraburkholderia hayleyella TaxID=2152889 RepID=UPI001290BF84|nr:protease modulator HflC [Paraburkholderia hayleyella]
MKRIIVLAVVVVLVLLALWSMVYSVDERHVALVVTRGNPVPLLAGPGLHVKLPPPLQQVTRVDTRTETFDAPEEGRYLTSDKAELLVNPVVKYRVTDPLKLFAETKGELRNARNQLALLSRNALRDVLTKYTLTDALAKQQDVAVETRSAIQKAAASLGIEVQEVALTRIDFPAAVAESIYKRMSAAREEATNAEKVQDAAEIEQLKAQARRQQEALMQEASSQAQEIKSEGDAKAALMAAGGYNRDPQFYQFYQSMQAYRRVFKPNDVIVVDSGNAFFRFMHSPDGAASPSAAARKP